MNLHIKQTLIRSVTSILLSTLLFATNAFALDLKTAKEQGLIGETSTGYIGVVDKGNSEAAALAQQVNDQRKALYTKIASDNGISVQAVELRAAEKAFSKTPAGQYIEQNGSWIKK